MAAERVDPVANYGAYKGWRLLPRSVLVEGTSDESLFGLAADLHRVATGKHLLADLAIVAAGEGDRGGTHGVVRELVVLRGLVGSHLSPAGRPIYRVIGLFDDDAAGRKAVNGARAVDTAIVEYRDVFRIRPVMPVVGNLDPGAVQRGLDKANESFKGLAWELEDLVGDDLIQLFLENHPTAMVREHRAGGACHRELTRDGKAKLVRFCRANADLASLTGVVDAIHALRCYMALPDLR